MQNNDTLFDKGIFTLSLDTEMAWGAVDKPNVLAHNKPYYEKSRDVTDKLLRLMEKYNISATWAIVGHLFLNECEKNNGQKHVDIPRSSYPWYEKDWFSECPCTSLQDAPIWYGKDIVEKILDCKVYQEIGSHSFSHIIYGDKNTKRETVAADLENCINAAKKADIEMNSFVFPRNKAGYLDEVRNAGFKVFRGEEPSWYKSFPSELKKICHIIDQTLAITPPVNNPIKREGMVDIPASMLYLPMSGFRKYIPIDFRVSKAEKGIKKAVKEKKIFHLWFHPFNIATNTEKLLEGLETIFKIVLVQREKGNIEVRTMNEISNLVDI